MRSKILSALWTVFFCVTGFWSYSVGSTPPYEKAGGPINSEPSELKPQMSGPVDQTLWPMVTIDTLKAQFALRNEKFDEALSHSLKALEIEPFHPELQILLGNAYEGLGDLTRAREAYAAAEKLSTDPLIHFQSRFNQAVVLAKEKKPDEAIAQYQRALEISPQSKEVKTNIELLLQSKKGQGEGENDGKGSDQNQGGSGNPSKKEKEPQKFQENPKDQGKATAQKNLSESDVKKILEELKQQEQRIRGDYYKQGQREERQKGLEGRREKDW